MRLIIEGFIHIGIQLKLTLPPTFPLTAPTVEIDNKTPVMRWKNFIKSTGEFEVENFPYLKDWNP